VLAPEELPRAGEGAAGENRSCSPAPDWVRKES
jgi:hypothetical protein